MLTTKTAYCCKTDSTKGEYKYTKVMRCLEALDITFRPTDSGICFGEDPIGTPDKLFNMTQGTVQLCVIHQQLPI
jgi:hypothetical protein